MKSRFVFISLYLSLATLTSLLILPDLPSAWYRILNICLPIQIIALLRIDSIQNDKYLLTFAIVVCSGFCALFMYYFLSKSGGEPYVPYQSTVGVYINGGDEGTGRARALEYYRQNGIDR